VYVTTNLGRLFYTESGVDRSGEGRAIVLLHGYLFDGRLFRYQRAPLSELGRVLIFDSPGHGKSEVPPYFTLEENADAMRDALVTLGVRRAVIVGLSWGGFLGMRLALRHPDLLSGMALLNTKASGDPIGHKLRAHLLVRSLRRGMFSMEDYRRKIAPSIFTREFRASSDISEETGRNMLGFSREGLYRSGLAVLAKRTDILPKLSTVQTKTLVIGGERDRLTPFALSEEIARAMPYSQLVRTTGGHMSTLENPDEVNAALVPFVREALGDWCFSPMAAR